MSIVFCYYDSIEHDSRAMEELITLSHIDKVIFVSYERTKDEISNVSFRTTKRKRNYIDFIHLSHKTIKEEKPQLVFLHDNFCSPIVSYLRNKFPQVKIVYDMSELYIGKDHVNRSLMNRIKTYYLRRCEYNYLEYVDGVIAANIERAYIAKGYYALKQLPFVLDNCHYVESQIDASQSKVYDKYFDNPKFTVLYVGGLDSAEGRDTYKLIEDIYSLGQEFQLLIAGKYTKKNMIIEEYLSKSDTNIYYLGMLTRADLKYLYMHSDVNVVTFDLSTINNIFCASGKLYEGLYEHCPIVVSENPPLANLCTNHMIGVVASQNDYKKAVLTIKEDYSSFKFNVDKYISSLDYSKRLISLESFLRSFVKGEFNENI